MFNVYRIKKKKVNAYHMTENLTAKMNLQLFIFLNSGIHTAVYLLFILFIIDFILFLANYRWADTSAK